MTEPRYVDDAFDDRDMTVDGQDFLEPDWCREAFDATGRTRHQFKNDREISKWRGIDARIRDGTLDTDWVQLKCDQARDYGWSFNTLMGAILNIGKMDDWRRRNRKFA